MPTGCERCLGAWLDQDGRCPACNFPEPCRPQAGPQNGREGRRPDTLSGYYLFTELPEELHKSARALRRDIAAGRLSPGLKQGGAHYFSCESVQAYREAWLTVWWDGNLMVTSSQAAERLGCSRDWVASLVGRGILSGTPGVPVSGNLIAGGVVSGERTYRIYVNECSLRQYMEWPARH